MSSVQGTASQVLVNNTSGSPVGGAITLTLPSAVVISSTLTSGGIIATGGATSGSAGQGIFSGNSTYGAIIGGSGGTYDVTLSNNVPSIVMGIPTGTLHVSFFGTLTTSGKILVADNNIGSFAQFDSGGTSRDLLKLDGSNNLIIASAGGGLNSVMVNLNGATQGVFTATGLNSCAIGVTTASTGNFTGLTASSLALNTALTSGDLLDISASTTGIGTVTVTATGTTVSGTSTVFTRQFRVGDTITANTETHTISVIASDTSMTTDAWTNNFGPGTFTLVGGARWNMTSNGNLYANGSAVLTNGLTALLTETSTYTNHNYNAIRFLPTINISDGGNHTNIGAILELIVNATVSPTSTGSVGLEGVVQFSAANTQNWTASIPATGAVLQVNVAAGATGTASGTIYGTKVVLNASTMTWTSAIGYGVATLSTTSGSIGSAASFASVLPTGTVTNYTGLLLGTLTIPAGTWGIYDITGYNWYVTGSIINASDRRIKTDIVTIKNGLDLILKLNPVSYSTQTDSRTHFGLIAQEVKEITGDHSIVEFSNDRYGLNYTQFIAPLISSTQTLYNKIKNLEEEIKQLKEKP